MKEYTLQMICAGIALQLVSASEMRIEVRHLQFSGTVPNDTMLGKLVEDDGAQASRMISQVISEKGSTTIKSTNEYAYPKNHWREGGQNKPDSKPLLGWSGEVVTSGFTDKFLNLKIDLTDRRMGSPHVHEVEGEQVATPTFSSDQLQSHLQIEVGRWRFFNLSPGSNKESSKFFAVRVTNN